MPEKHGGKSAGGGAWWRSGAFVSFIGMFGLGLASAGRVSPRRIVDSVMGRGGLGQAVDPEAGYAPENTRPEPPPRSVEVEAEGLEDGRPTTLRSRAFITFIVMFGVGLAAWWPMMAYLSVFVRDILGQGILAASFLLVAIHGVTATLGLASGPFIRRYGSKWTYTLGLVGLAIFMLALGLSADFKFVLVMAPVMGFFLAFHWTGAQSYVIEASPAHQRGLGSGVATFAATLVPAASAPILGLIADANGFGTMALVAFGIVATGLVITTFALPNIRPVIKRVQAATETVAATEKPGGMGRLLRMPGIGWMLLVRGSTSMMLGVFVLLAGPKLIDSGGLMSSIGFFVAGTSLGGGLAQVGIGWASDRLGRRKLLVMTLVVGVVSSVAFGLTDNLLLLLVASGFHGLFRNATQTLLVAVTGDITPPSETGRVSSLLTSSFSLGMVVGTLVAGAFFEISELTPFVIAAVIVMAAIAGLYRIPMRAAEVGKAV